MQLKTLITSLALTATALAVPATPATNGVAKVKNNCSFPVYVWSVASTVGPLIIVPAKDGITDKNAFTEALHYDPATGVAIKIGTSETAINTAAPLLHLSYSLNIPENSIYYDLSTVFGLDPLFQGRRFVLKGTEGKVPAVPTIEWYGGAPSGTRAYFGDTDLILTLCA